MEDLDKNCIKPDCLCDNRHDVHPYKHDEIPECKCGGSSCKPLSSLDKAFDKKFVKTPAGVPVILKKYTLIDGRESYDLWTPEEILKFIRQREKDLIKEVREDIQNLRKEIQHEEIDTGIGIDKLEYEGQEKEHSYNQALFDAVDKIERLHKIGTI